MRNPTAQLIFGSSIYLTSLISGIGLAIHILNASAWLILGAYAMFSVIAVYLNLKREKDLGCKQIATETKDFQEMLEMSDKITEKLKMPSVPIELSNTLFYNAESTSWPFERKISIAPELIAKEKAFVSAILAHELAHIYLKHSIINFSQIVVRKVQLIALLSSLFVGCILSGIHLLKLLGTPMFATFFAPSFTGLLLLSTGLFFGFISGNMASFALSRATETAADFKACEILEDANIFYRYLRENKKLIWEWKHNFRLSLLESITLTHPSNQQRMEDIKNQFPKINFHNDDVLDSRIVDENEKSPAPVVFSPQIFKLNDKISLPSTTDSVEKEEGARLSI